jgi:hypothetical protein
MASPAWNVPLIYSLVFVNSLNSRPGMSSRTFCGGRSAGYQHCHCDSHWSQDATELLKWGWCNQGSELKIKLNLNIVTWRVTSVLDGSVQNSVMDTAEPCHRRAHTLLSVGLYCATGATVGPLPRMLLEAALFSSLCCLAVFPEGHQPRMWRTFLLWEEI